jgi:hypothetical protein
MSGTFVPSSQRVFLPAGGLERLHQAADLRVHETRAGEIRAAEIAPLVGFFDPLEPRLGQIPVQIPGEARGVIAVAAQDLGQQLIAVRVEVIPLLGDVAGHVRQEVAHGQEQRLILAGLLQLFDGPTGDLIVALVLVAMRKHAPVHQWMVAHGRGGNEFLRRLGADAGGGAAHCEIFHRLGSRAGFRLALGLAAAPAAAAGGALMKNFSRRPGAVAGGLEVLRQRHAVLELRQRAERRRQAVDAGGRRPQPGEQAGARGIAQRRLAMRVEEGGAAPGQRVEVGRPGQRMPAQVADPIVLIINGDEQDVRLAGGRGNGGRTEQNQNREETGERFHDASMRTVTTRVTRKDAGTGGKFEPFRQCCPGWPCRRTLGTLRP